MATPNFRARGFSVVVHNVFNEPEYWTKVVDGMKYDRTVVSIEPYAHQDGFHLHVFTENKNPCRAGNFFRVLEQAKLGHVETDEGKGRIQIDSRKGTFQEATAYLTQDLTKKDKVCGNPIVESSHPTCMDCGVKERVFYMGMSFMNGTFKCQKCTRIYELREIYSKTYGSLLEFKAALDDFDDVVFGERT